MQTYILLHTHTTYEFPTTENQPLCNDHYGRPRSPLMVIMREIANFEMSLIYL